MGFIISATAKKEKEKSAYQFTLILGLSTGISYQDFFLPK
jgi:hypothetical protein